MGFMFICFLGRLAVILIGLFTLAVGIILSSIPWLDYIILKVGINLIAAKYIDVVLPVSKQILRSGPLGGHI